MYLISACDAHVFIMLRFIQIILLLQFSANPGRFSLTEICTDDNGQESTEIRAEFPWGQETIETIHNVSTKMFDNLDPADQETFLVSVELWISTLCLYNWAQVKFVQSSEHYFRFFKQYIKFIFIDMHILYKQNYFLKNLY